jgi:DNA-binding HxlR family transcriptional regulator
MRRANHDQFCALACALDLIGDRWAMLIVRELLFGAKRFTDLLDGLPGIGTNTLTTRLDELEVSGTIARRRLPPPLAVTIIELTPRGRALEPVLVALVRWGTVPLLSRKPRHGLRPAWLGLAMRSYFDASAARGSPMRVELRLCKGTLTVELDGVGLRIREGEPTEPADLRITAPEMVVLDILRGVLSEPAASRKRAWKLEGKVQLLPRLLAAFPIGAGAFAQSP